MEWHSLSLMSGNCLCPLYGKILLSRHYAFPMSSFFIFFWTKVLLSKSLTKSKIPFLSLVSQVFLLPRCPKDFFLFHFINSRDSTEIYLAASRYWKVCLFNMYFQFCLYSRTFFLITCFSIFSGPLLQFPFSATPIIHILDLLCLSSIFINFIWILISLFLFDF